MPQLFLYLIFALTAAAGGQNLRADVDNPLDHVISFAEQEINADWNQSSDSDGPDDYCLSYALPAVSSQLIAHSYTLPVPSTHSSYRAYSARAPPVFLS